MVAEDVETDRHPGRPGYRYRPIGTDPVTEAAAYRRLAGLLARAVRTGAGARDAGRAAGATDAARLAGADPVAAMNVTLAYQGFAPEIATLDAERVDVILHACPFADAAAEDPATICQLHLGLAEGAAQAIGGLQRRGAAHRRPAPSRLPGAATPSPPDPPSRMNITRPPRRRCG